MQTDILFWSGGKDAYLALEFVTGNEEDETALKLLTTYEKTSGVVPHQNIPMETIREQAEYLGLELVEVPLPAGCSNDTYLERVTGALDTEPVTIRNLFFGDWHLQDIRTWRETEFGRFGYDCRFPIWRKSIHELLPLLILKPVEIKISAVGEPCKAYISVGETYDMRFVGSLPRDIDPMGENGEFHTEVIFKRYTSQYTT